MPFRVTILFFSLVSFLISHSPATAQEHRFRTGGGAGFSFMTDPELDFPRAGNLGGFFGIRLNDQFTLETAFSFSRAKQLFTADNQPVVDQQGQNQTTEETPTVLDPAFQQTIARYHLDLSLFYHIGRRQPFHPFLFGGGGMVLEEQGHSLIEEVTIGDPVKSTEYQPTVTFGAGFDFYIIADVSARFQYQWLFQAKDTNRRTSRLFFTATYYF